MEPQTVTIELDPAAAAILRTLQEKAEAQGVSLASLLAPIAEEANGTVHEEKSGQVADLEHYEGPTPFELAGDLIGSIDSSVPDPDPDAQPRPTALGDLVAEKLRKQGLYIP